MIFEREIWRSRSRRSLRAYVNRYRMYVTLSILSSFLVFVAQFWNFSFDILFNASGERFVCAHNSQTHQFAKYQCQRANTVFFLIIKTTIKYSGMLYKMDRESVFSRIKKTFLRRIFYTKLYGLNDETCFALSVSMEEFSSPTLKFWTKKLFIHYSRS